MPEFFFARNSQPHAARLVAFGLALASGLSGCSVLGPHLSRHGVSGAAVELSTVPFYPQDEYQSGPAALAMVLGAQGVAVNPDALVRQIYSPGREGSLQVEVAAASRTYGLVPYEIPQSKHPDADVAKEVLAGHPVLVLQNLGSSDATAWHFAVVIGVDPENNTFILRSGREERQILSDGEFLAAWRDGGNWGIVVVKPGDIPVTADLRHWVAAIAPFERLGKAGIAERAYLPATERWSQDALAWEALANARHQLADFVGASKAFSTALKIEPTDTVARNNFAYVLLERRCPDQAEAQINLAIAAETDPQKITNFRRTLAKIRDYSGPSVTCQGI